MADAAHGRLCCSQAARVQEDIEPRRVCGGAALCSQRGENPCVGSPPPRKQKRGRVRALELQTGLPERAGGGRGLGAVLGEVPRTFVTQQQEGLQQRVHSRAAG